MRVGVSGFVPERLTQARVLASMTRLELSERLEKSSSSVSRWEKGESAPEAEALEAISFVLGFPVSWFMLPVSEKPPSTVFFRTLASTSSDLRGKAGTRMDWLQDIARYFSTWLDWPEINIPEINVTDHRQLDYSDIARAAQECRERWGLGQAPIADLALAAEGAGIICARIHQGNTKMDGLSQWDELQKLPFILLSNDKGNYFRSRFDLAHEIGHIVLHRHIKTFDIKHLKEIEGQANFFASCLLLPEESLSIELPSYPSLENLLGLKKRWRVSVAAIIYRADKLGLIGEQETLRLRKSYSARGWAKCEPFDDQVEVEQVRLLSRAVRTITDEKIKTKETIARDLMLPYSSIEQLCGLPAGFFEPKVVQSLDPIPKLKEALGVNAGNVVEFKKRT